MRFLTLFAKSLTNFLFPRPARVLSLETQSASDLLTHLPPSTLEEPNTTALFSYQDPLVKEIVWEVKYKGNRTLAEKLGRLLYDVVVAELEERQTFEKYDSVVLLPMPISDKRRLERGWNQAELLAGALKAEDKANRFKYLPRQLVKIRHTESQTRTATRSERLHNLGGSMLVQHPPAVASKCVVLVDDVTTTGSTFAEAKRALRLAGAKRIFCFAIAH